VARENSFEGLVTLWQERYDAFRGSGIDVRQTEDYEDKLSESKRVITSLESVAQDCMRLTEGLKPAVATANPETAKLVCPFPRLFKVASIEHVHEAARDTLGKVIEETFILGLVSHLILFNHPARRYIEGVDKAGLFARWSESAAVADIQLRAYNRECNGIPEGVFMGQYAARVRPLLKEQFRVGFWREGKFQSRFRNVFYSGCFLGMLGDMAANALS